MAVTMGVSVGGTVGGRTGVGHVRRRRSTGVVRRVVGVSRRAAAGGPQGGGDDAAGAAPQEGGVGEVRGASELAEDEALCDDIRGVLSRLKATRGMGWREAALVLKIDDDGARSGEAVGGYVNEFGEMQFGTQLELDVSEFERAGVGMGGEYDTFVEGPAEAGMGEEDEMGMFQDVITGKEGLSYEEQLADEARRVITREELGECLEKVAGGKTPEDRELLQALAAEMYAWPEIGGGTMGGGLRIEGSSDLLGDDARPAAPAPAGAAAASPAQQRQSEYARLAQAEEQDGFLGDLRAKLDEAKVPAPVAYIVIYGVASFPVFLAIGAIAILFFKSLA